MKRTISLKISMLIFISSLSLFHANGQEFSGYRSGNYTGVNGVLFNPSSIAASPYRWDISLLGLDAITGNNQVSFNMKDFGNTFGGNNLKNRIFSPSSGPTSALASVILNGPSGFYNLNKKSAMAITIQSRVLVNIMNLDGKLGNQLFNSNLDSSNLPYTISSSQNMTINLNAYTAFGISYARVLMDKGNQSLKAGITFKYLAGTANGYMKIDQLNTTLNMDAFQNVYATNASGSFSTGFGGLNLSNFQGKDLLKFNSSGFGADFGLTYIFRVSENKLEGVNASSHIPELNSYKFRIGLALLNVGSIRYTRDMSSSGGYTIHIPNGQQFYLSSLSSAGINNLKDSLNQYPQYFTPNSNDSSSSYAVSLPTTLQIDIDYHLNKGFFLNLAGQASLTHSLYNSGYYSMLTLTPRYETKLVGVFVPLSYNSLTRFNAGLALRIGPLYLGSDSILSALLGKTRQADAYIGLHIGILKKDRGPKK